MGWLRSSLVAEGTGVRKRVTNLVLCSAEEALAGIMQLHQGLSDFNMHDSPADLLNADLEFIGLVCGLRFSIFNKFSGDADHTGSQITL